MTASSTVAPTDVITGTLRVPDAELYYEVRGDGPPLVLVAAPMDADSFAPVAELLAADHRVVTTDPRGINRSPVDDPTADSTPEQRADDLSRVLTHLGVGPVTILGSSGGAVSVLALAQTHPEQVHTVIAHEPPLYGVVTDRDRLIAESETMIDRYLTGDREGAWRQFMATADIELPEEVFAAMFLAEPEPQALADERYQFEHMLRATTRWQPDLDTLRATTSRVLIGIGEDSAGELCDRTSRALATSVGVEPVLFPGGHIGFAEDPELFARRLRSVLHR